MATALARLRTRLPKVKRWVAIAVPVGALLVIYLGFQGLEYRSVSSDSEVTEAKIRNIGVATSEGIPDLEALEAELELRNELLDEWTGVFTIEGYPTTTDPLLEILTATAGETGVELKSVVLKPPEDVVIAQLRYQAHTVVISLGGETHFDIYNFARILHEKAPSVSAYNVNLAGFDGSPRAEMTLRFFLTPETVE